MVMFQILLDGAEPCDAHEDRPKVILIGMFLDERKP